MKANPNESYWYSSEMPLASKCASCPDFGVCGGLRIAKHIQDCQQLCKCIKGAMPNFVCTCNAKHFVCRKREVGGWELTVPIASNATHPDLPHFAPMIYGLGGRIGKLESNAVAIPLSRLLGNTTGKIKIEDRSELNEKFGINPNSKMILSGVHFDQMLEAYWSVGRKNEVVAAIRASGVDIVTSPNFSLFPDVPRWDNLHNMKRIAICWYELAAAGVATALHVNARTPRDYERWAEFITAHPEIHAISVEFQTGLSSPKRGSWHARQLKLLAETVNRPLDVITYGGQQHIKFLASTFRRMTYVSSTPYMKSAHRFELKASRGRKESWRRARPTATKEGLLAANIKKYSERVSRLCA